ncbi:MAG: hypothetical protein OXK20_00450 [Deltaproteobacteria bacterium]|nr:hypothetical protein [Deltaproteobacteria bacterium]
MRMFMLAVLATVVVAPVCSMAQVQYTPPPAFGPVPHSDPAGAFYQGFKQGQDIGRSLAPLLQKRQPPRQAPPRRPRASAPPARQPKGPPLDYHAAVSAQGFRAYLNRLLDAKSQTEVVVLIVERQQFLGFTDAALRQGMNELRFIQHLVQLTKEAKEKR